MRLIQIVLGGSLVVGAALGTGCMNDPEYIPGPTDLEGGITPMKGGGFEPAKATMTLPIKPETTADATKRAAVATTLGMMVPYVKVDDIEVSVSWTVKNLDTNPGSATVELNGGNEYVYYDPSTIKLPGGDEAPPTPGLSGDIPMDVPAGGSISGVFTEDQVVAASIALDEISQGNFTPYAAILVDGKNDATFQPLSLPMPADPTDPEDTDVIQVPMGNPIPREAFALMIRYDMVLKADHHMVMDYDVRIRDLRGILPKDLMSTPSGLLTTFDPALYVLTITGGATD